MEWQRRDLMRGAAVGMLAVLPLPALAQDAVVTLVADPADPVANSEPGRWAAGELRSRYDGPGPRRAAGGLRHLGPERTGYRPRRHRRARDSRARRGTRRPAGRSGSGRCSMPGMLDNRAVLLAAGSDAAGPRLCRHRIGRAGPQCARRGRGTCSSAPPSLERPANRVRSVARFVTNEVEDRGWLHDRQFWHGYLTMLAGHRFNSFSLTLGIQYDYPQEVSDVYFYFAYPFLLKVPGYDVVAAGLPDDERDRNLETLRFIARETARRGLRFRLGIWTHAYAFDSPRVNYRDHRHHGGEPRRCYCRDALAMLLRAGAGHRRPHLPAAWRERHPRR